MSQFSGKPVGIKLSKVKQYFYENLEEWYNTHPDVDLNDPNEQVRAYREAGGNQGPDLPLDDVWELFLENDWLEDIEYKLKEGQSSVTGQELKHGVLVDLLDDMHEEQWEDFRNREWKLVELCLPDWRSPVFKAWKMTNEPAYGFGNVARMEREEADKFMAFMQEYLGIFSCVYVGKFDQYVVNQAAPTESDDIDLERFDGTEINIGGELKHVYPIGEGWHWYTPEEAASAWGKVDYEDVRAS